MRRYTVTVDDRTWTIDVHQVAADRFQVTVGDATFEATIEEEGDLPGAAISPEIPVVADARPAPPPRIAAQPPASGALAVPVATPGGAPADALAAPLPGVVLEIRVAAGTAVRRGDPILVIEAMKMRNTIRAPRDAVVAEVAVETGQPVGPGDLLVRLGPAG
jgi:glutaconyl-CoA/methylmalonyl-CoA decarboxylase subunit gamma